MTDLQLPSFRPEGFGIYIHWPFCAAKCPYCDFNSHVSRNIDHAQWKDAYLREIDTAAEETGERLVRSVFFGGGTPSLMPPKIVSAILEKIGSLYILANDLEVTLEANPSSVEAARFAGYRTAGVNRISIGVQALNDTDLRRLGRLHDVASALEAIELGHAQFERISFDLIYARQYQTVSAWEAELKQALEIAGGHLSLYQLTIEPGTAFGKRHQARGLPGLPDEDTAADMYLLTQELCDRAGMPAYEVSNHARAGEESRHNLLYWQLGDYLGIGPGAHGRLTIDGARYAIENIREPGHWLDSVQRQGHGKRDRNLLTSADTALEHLLMGLRTADGISLSNHAALAGRPLDQSRLATLQEEGLIRISGDRIAATERGWLVLDSLIAELAR